MLTPQMMAMLALQNPALAGQVAAMSGQMPPGPTTGPAATSLPGGAPPMAPSLPQLQAMGGAPQAGGLASLGSALSAVQPSQAQQPPRAPAVSPQGQNMAQPNILQLMQYLAGGMPAGVPSLGSLLTGR